MVWFLFSSFNLSYFNSSFFFTPQLFSGLLGVLGACLEKPGLVFVFALLFVLFDIVAIFILGIVGSVSQPFMLSPLAFMVTIKSTFFITCFPVFTTIFCPLYYTVELLVWKKNNDA